MLDQIQLEDCTTIFTDGTVFAHTWWQCMQRRLFSVYRRMSVEGKTEGICGLIDIGCNLIDPMYRGEYRGKQKHPSDMLQVLQRAKQANVSHIMVTAGSLTEAKEAVELIESLASKVADGSTPKLYSTVGVHPTRTLEFEENPDLYLSELLEVGKRGVEKGIIVAVGECGLDYDPDRMKFSSKEIQLKHFEKHFVLSEQLKLPMFLHNRDSTEDLVQILSENRNRFSKAVVHSFTGSVDDVQKIISLDGVYIGINGCSLKTEENLEAMASIPLDRLLIETDGPWCDIRATHDGFKYVQSQWEVSKKPEKHNPDSGLCVKNRTEPCHIR
jgi:TatD DNase family protein